MFNSSKFKGVITAYFGSLFVDHCMADNLVSHSFEFLKKFRLNANFVPALGMDGPNLKLVSAIFY